MLHQNGMEHFHNQTVVCCSLLIVSPRAIEIAKALAIVTLNYILARELKIEPLADNADTSIREILMYYTPMNDLSYYILYIVIMLVDFCLLRANNEDNLNLVIIFYVHTVKPLSIMRCFHTSIIHFLWSLYITHVSNLLTTNIFPHSLFIFHGPFRKNG
jgi:hypothetical protein